MQSTGQTETHVAYRSAIVATPHDTWQCASHIRTGMVLDTIEMARWVVASTLRTGLARATRAVDSRPFARGERLAEIGAPPLIGTVLPAKFEGSFYAE